jgi:hypothetical protein
MRILEIIVQTVNVNYNDSIIIRIIKYKFSPFEQH